MLWEGAGDRTELKHIDPHSYDHQRCVFLVLQGCSTGGPRAQLSAGWWLSLSHHVSNSSDLQLPDFQSSPSYIIVQSPTQYLPMTGHQDVSFPPSLEWHVWSSSSGNNCHAVHMSLSSGASVCECTAGFYLVPFCQPSPPTWFLLITAIGICHFLPVHHFGMACLAGSKVNIQQKENPLKNDRLSLYLLPSTKYNNKRKLNLHIICSIFFLFLLFNKFVASVLLSLSRLARNKDFFQFCCISTANFFLFQVYFNNNKLIKYIFSFIVLNGWKSQTNDSYEEIPGKYFFRVKDFRSPFIFAGRDPKKRGHFVVEKIKTKTLKNIFLSRTKFKRRIYFNFSETK